MSEEEEIEEDDTNNDVLVQGDDAKMEYHPFNRTK